MSSCNDPCGDSISIVVDTSSAGPIGPPGPAAKVLEWTFYLNPGDTIVSGDDASAKPLAYTPDSVQCYLNGVQLSKRDDYTTDADGNAIVLNEAIVNANDILVVISQVPPENYDPTNDNNRLQGQIDDNKEAIEGLDVRVTANEEAIEGLTGLADGVTTRSVKVSGVSPQRGRGEDLQTQQDINYLFDGEILENTARLEALEGGQPDLTSDIADLRTDVDENTQGISDNAQALNDLVDVVEANANGIDGLQDQLDKLPPPADLSDIEQDLTDVSLQVGKNTLGIADATKRLDELEEPIDLDPLNEAISLNALGISSNAADITKLQATDAKQAGEIGKLQGDVVQLQDDVSHIDLTDVAYTTEDNEFVSQTIQDGITLRGKTAAFKADTGTAFTFDCNNAINTVVSIRKSGGNEAISLAANGNIRGVVTDGDDLTSAVSVGYLEDNGIGGGDHAHDIYATKIQLKDEELARQLADQELQKSIEALESYDDSALSNAIKQEEDARKAADSSLGRKLDLEAQYRKDEDTSLQDQIDALQSPAVDPALYATVVAMEKGDADTLAAANTFTTEAIADIEFPEGVDLTGLASEEWVTEQIADFATENFVEEAIGAIEFPDGVDLTGYATEEFVTDAIAAIEFPAGTVVGETPPADAEEGATWYDTVRLELFVFASNAWLPCSPLGARVEQGEIVQAQILSQINVSLAEQESLRNQVGNLDETALVRDENGHTTVEQEWRLRAKATDNSTWTFLKIGNNELGAYHLQDPKEWHHAANRRYVDNSIADGNFASKDDANTFKENQTFQKSSYFQNAIIHNGKNADTLTEVRGDHEDGTKQFWNKIRGTCRVSWICYPGQENKDYKKCLEMEWDAEANRPLVKLDYLQTPTESRHAATKSYVDAEVAKAGGGSDGAKANSGTTTPSLSTGEMFFNTSDKVLYIGE